MHPKHLVNSIPYGEMLRLRRICSNEEDLATAQKDSKRRFMEIGYQGEVIDKAIKRSMQLGRTETLMSKQLEETNQKSSTFRYIMKYNNQHKPIQKIIQKNWPMVLSDPVIGPMLPQRVSITYSRAPSTRDKIVKTNPEVMERGSWLNMRKGFYKCKACLHAINKNTYKTPFCDREYKIIKLLTCRTEFAVYVLLCPCGLQYVGSTVLQVHKLILQHLRTITNQDNTYPVAHHFKEKHNSNSTELKYFVLDTVPQVDGVETESTNLESWKQDIFYS